MENKDSFTRDEVDDIIRQAVSRRQANRPSTSRQQYTHQGPRHQPQQGPCQQQPQQPYGQRPTYSTPPGRGVNESRIDAFISRLSKIPDHNFGQYFNVLKLILTETRNDISCLALIEKSLDDMEDDMGKKGFAPTDFKPCRWYNVGNCGTLLPAHVEDKDHPSNDRIRTHLCVICFEILNRAHHHPGFQCKLLRFLDNNEVPQVHANEQEGAGAAHGTAPDPKIPRTEAS